MKLLIMNRLTPKSNSFFAIFDKFKKRLLFFWQNYTAKYGKAIKDGYKSNAFSPIAWYCYFLIIPLGFGCIYTKNTIVQIIFLVLIIIIILFPLVMYFLLFKKDPKLLQSEAYRIRDKTLDIIAQKGGEILVNPVDLTNAEIGNEPADE